MLGALRLDVYAPNPIKDFGYTIKFLQALSAASWPAAFQCALQQAQ